MAERERDPLTGRWTTGHEWDGIKELTTPIPHWWVSTFLGSIAVALLYVYLYPSFATTGTHLPGALGWTSRGELALDTAAARQAQSGWRARINAAPLEEVAGDQDLRRFALRGGRALFNENCAPCHGVGGPGRIGQFPALLDDDWIWGGTLAQIYQTVRHGIRNEDAESRQSMMPPFADSLSPQEIDALADYVVTLSQPGLAETRTTMPGAALFAENCAGCHGETGGGTREMGAPRLDDHIWLYGGTKAAIAQQIAQPRMGVMPSFARLPEEDLRMLAIYVHALGGGE